MVPAIGIYLYISNEVRIMLGVDTRPIRLVVVDDDEVYSKFIRTRLSKDAPELEITTLTSGSECLEYIRENEADCILSDYQMPGMDGSELQLRLRELGYEIPLIFLTGQGSEHVARDAFKNGAHDYFTKGTGFARYDRIINSIRQAVSRARAEKNRRLAESALRNTAEGVSGLTGVNFFHSLVEYLARSLGVGCAYIGRLVHGDKYSIETVSVHCFGEPAENFSYRLEGSPCENVVGKEHCCFPRDLKSLYPDLDMMKELGVESYVGSPLFDSAGCALGVLVVMHTKPIENQEMARSLLRIFASRAAAELERLHNDAALRESEARFRKLVENSIVGVVLVQDRRFVYVNPTYAGIIGYTPEELKGDVDVLSLVHPEDRPLVEENIRKRIDGEVESIRYSFRMLRKDGTPVEVEVHGARTEHEGRPAVVAVMTEKSKE